MGLRSIRTTFQTRQIEDETRVALWNTLLEFESALNHMGIGSSPWSHNSIRVIEKIWADHFRRPHDELQTFDQVWGLVKNCVLTGLWNEVLDLIEAFVKYTDQSDDFQYITVKSQLPGRFNSLFEQELVGYRIIGTEITPITEERDVEAVEEALDQLVPYSGARQHLEQAVESLSDRSSPNYAHSISESVKAVEGVVQKLTETNASLGDGLNKLAKAGLEIHPALKEAWRKMYGWTSDDKGIRHASSEATNVDQSLAKYMLISCSAFVSYLIEEGIKKDLISVSK